LRRLALDLRAIGRTFGAASRDPSRQYVALRRCRIVICGRVAGTAEQVVVRVG
jgi:hypothetical protein